MRLIGVMCLALLTTSACVFGDSSDGPVGELTEVANKAAGATYAAVYTFTFVQRVRPGETTKLEIVQKPPAVVRRVETSTRPEQGKPITLTAWYIRNDEGSFACSEYAQIGIRCQKRPLDASTFTSAKLNVFFDMPRQEDAFSSVSKASRPVRIAGEQGTCYEAVPVAASPAPGSPRPALDRYRYELCYAEDGVLLRGKRTALDEGGSAGGSESIVQVTTISRVVDPSELRLPGELVGPGDVPR